jgi:hydroxymethylbilane synthase
MEIEFKDPPDFENYQYFKDDLLDDKVDIIVHSHKNILHDPNGDTELFSVLKRGDSRDVLLFKKTSYPNPSNEIKIFISSDQKENSFKKKLNIDHFLKNYFPISLRSKSIHYTPCKGDTFSRLEEWYNSDLDGLVLPKYEIDRLLLKDYPQCVEEDLKKVRETTQKIILDSLFIVIPLSENPSLPGEGGIAVEFKKGREDLEIILEKIVLHCVREEIIQEKDDLQQLEHPSNSIGISYLKRGYGTILIKKAINPDGSITSIKELHTSHQPKAKSTSALFPQPNYTPYSNKKSIENFPTPPTGNLYVTLSEAWQEHWEKKDLSGIIWCAGLKAMKDLADKDIWVSGCSDGFGEGEDPDLSKFLANPHFLKLTHAESTSVISRYQRVFTYHLDLNVFPDLNGFTHFFWSSGYQFQNALKQYPAIKNSFHASTPGITRIFIQKTLGKPIDTFLSYEDWYLYHEK